MYGMMLPPRSCLEDSSAASVVTASMSASVRKM
jgi:hypothetical protein